MHFGRSKWMVLWMICQENMKTFPMVNRMNNLKVVVADVDGSFPYEFSPVDLNDMTRILGKRPILRGC